MSAGQHARVLGTRRRRRLIPVFVGLAMVTAVAASLTVAGAAARSRHAVPRLTPALARALSRNVDKRVIVLLRPQFRVARAGSTEATARVAEIRRAQAPLMAELRATHATHIVSYTLVDGFAATVSKGEQARLRANANVAEVIPDVIIRLASPATPARIATRRRLNVRTAVAGSPALVPNTIPGACSATTPSSTPRACR